MCVCVCLCVCVRFTSFIIPIARELDRPLNSEYKFPKLILETGYPSNHRLIFFAISEGINHQPKNFTFLAYLPYHTVVYTVSQEIKSP